MTLPTTACVSCACRVLKLPKIAAHHQDLAHIAVEQGWSHTEYLAEILAKQLSVREANSLASRLRQAKFPRHSCLEDFNFTHQPSVPRDLITHLGTCTWISKKRNVLLLGPPGVGKTHLAIALGIKACEQHLNVAFNTAHGWITRLAAAHDQGNLETELTRLGRHKLIIIDEVGYIPFDADAANLFFQLISRRYETASLIITSNLQFSAWGKALGDDVVAAATIDRLVYHADIIALKGNSYRTRNHPNQATPTVA